MNATIRGHQGFVIVMRYLKRRGPFCRTCGIATHREMTSDTLWQGWWGIPSMIVNPIVMLFNIPQRMKINKLAEPVPGAPGTPMDTGKPVYLRPTIVGLLIPAVLITLIFALLKDDPEFAKAGDCIHNSSPLAMSGLNDNNPDVKVVSCSDPQADARVVGRADNTTDGETECRKYPDADSYFTYKRGSDKYLLCLTSLKPRPKLTFPPAG
ncbi:hypothetical protein [Kitasatospora sp. NPDC096140]|uniref:LppU/SCO3897 family protein n=1 Tax=Kitasatospora sp. NPDC096140 TaxID=3155425 RepID=UPI003332A79D